MPKILSESADVRTVHSFLMAVPPSALGSHPETQVSGIEYKNRYRVTAILRGWDFASGFERTLE
jgi:hypothetical protein